jgi:hypothetical protein
MKLRAKSPLVCLLRECGIEPTLDDYLSASECDTLDVELLEVIPDGPLREEYERRLRHNADMNHRFEQQREAASKGRNPGREG